MADRVLYRIDRALLRSDRCRTAGVFGLKYGAETFAQREAIQFGVSVLLMRFILDTEVDMEVTKSSRFSIGTVGTSSLMFRIMNSSTPLQLVASETPGMIEQGAGTAAFTSDDDASDWSF